MKIVIVNGSPRKGNTVAAINAFISGAEEKNEIEVINADGLNISGCKGCNACQCTKGCIAQDDTNKTVDKIAAADMIVFASPVYWWGITAQTKLVIDKMYCRGANLKGKKVGMITVGGAKETDNQYNLIRSQYESMAGYLGWDIVFNKAYSANGKDDLAADSAAMAEMKEIGSSI